MSRSRSLVGVVCVAVVAAGIMFGLNWLFPTAAMELAGFSRNLIRWVGPLTAGVLAAWLIVALAAASDASDSDSDSYGYGSRGCSAVRGWGRSSERLSVRVSGRMVPSGGCGANTDR